MSDEKTKDAPVAEVQCLNLNCKNCKTLADCKTNTAEVLKEAQEALSKDTGNEKLKEKVKKAKEALVTDTNAVTEVCSDFKPNGKLPKEVESAFALVAAFDEPKMNLFEWRLENLTEKRRLEKELGIKIGEPFTLPSGQELGTVVDLERGKVRVRKPNGKYAVIKLSVTDEEEDEE